MGSCKLPAWKKHLENELTFPVSTELKYCDYVLGKSKKRNGSKSFPWKPNPPTSLSRRNPKNKALWVLDTQAGELSFKTREKIP